MEEENIQKTSKNLIVYVKNYQVLCMLVTCPLFAFGSWSRKNCDKLPILTKYLKSIPNLKVALLSKMGFYSNNVIRCHYGLHIPSKKCSMLVKQNDNANYEKKFHKYKKWLIFDDYKEHYAQNESDKERIILIIENPVATSVG